MNLKKVKSSDIKGIAITAGGAVLGTMVGNGITNVVKKSYPEKNLGLVSKVVLIGLGGYLVAAADEKTPGGQVVEGMGYGLMVSNLVNLVNDQLSNSKMVVEKASTMAGKPGDFVQGMLGLACPNCDSHKSAMPTYYQSPNIALERPRKRRGMGSPTLISYGSEGTLPYEKELTAQLF